MPYPPAPPRPYREPLAATLRRTLAITAGITTGLALALAEPGSFWSFWARTCPAVLWFPLGGHYVELAYLNFLRMRWAWFHRRRRSARVLVWIAGGLPLGLACWWTWRAMGFAPAWRLHWWWGMPFFPAVECVVHGVLSACGRPSFWNGRE